MKALFPLSTLSVCLLLAACGGGGGGGGSSVSGPSISGVAASGSPITPAMNGVVTLKDSSSTPKTVSTATDANGNYSFTATQLAGLTAPFMLEISYQVGGVNYYLHSAATAADLSSGKATINITPLTDLVIATVAHEIAQNVFNQGNFAATLTSSALQAGATALAAQLQPVLQAAGVSASVDLLHQSFQANGSGLDGVLDSLKVTVDPTTQQATIVDRLNQQSIVDDITQAAASNTSVLSTSGSVPLTDLQAINLILQNLSKEMSAASSASDPALLAYFDQNNFQDDGKSLALFLQEVTSQPAVAGGNLVISNVVLSAVPAWVSNVPSGATAYLAHFQVTMNKSPSEHAFVVYKNAAGTWLALGNQRIMHTEVDAIAAQNTMPNGNGSFTTSACSGLLIDIADKGGTAGVNYAVISGPGVPNGLIAFNDGSGLPDSFQLSTSTYQGTTTTPIPMSSACFFTQLLALNDSQIAAVPAGGAYTIALYNDNGTPTNPSDDILKATYTVHLAAQPLLSTQLSGVFASNPTASSSLLTAAAATAGSSADMVNFTWTPPTVPGLFADDLWVWVANATTNNLGVDTSLASSDTTAQVAIPSLSNATSGGGNIEYTDSSYRLYWTSVNF